VERVFEVAAGSVTGREHAAAFRNNQDAFCHRSSGDAVLAVVADGCSAGAFSEVGARLGARLVLDGLARALPRLQTRAVADVLESVRLGVLRSLRRLAAAMGGPRPAAVLDHLLFTVVGAALTPEQALVFVLGDGVAVVNGHADVWTFEDNRPPYLGESLLDLPAVPAASRRFRTARVLSAAEVESLVIGTDGVADLLRAEERRVPGREERVGPLRQFWEDDRYFRNPAALSRRLAVLNRDWRAIDWDRRRVEREAGLLPDDTTLVVIRRRRS
jgi:hypothetical protein